jgi:hypothetical protein
MRGGAKVIIVGTQIFYLSFSIASTHLFIL